LALRQERDSMIRLAPLLLIASCASAPVEHVYLWASVAGMPDDLVERHMQLLCTEVRPNL
jgi:hypothetical protein